MEKCLYKLKQQYNNFIQQSNMRKSHGNIRSNRSKSYNRFKYQSKTIKNKTSKNKKYNMKKLKLNEGKSNLFNFNKKSKVFRKPITLPSKFLRKQNYINSNKANKILQ